jgi:hypothetical protein
LRSAFGRPPIWLVAWALGSLLALAPALLMQGWMQSTLAHRYEPGALFGNLDTTFRFDHRAETELLDASTGSLGAALVVLAILIGIFTSGGWLQVFLEPTRGHSLRRFFLGGARYFWRFFRLAFLTVLVLSVWTWIVQGPAWDKLILETMLGIPAGDFRRLETLPSGRTAFLVRGCRESVYAVGFALVLAWGDFARARLALHDTSSALWSGLCTAFTIVRHPVKTLWPMTGLLVVEAAIVVVAGAFARLVEARIGQGSGLGSVALLLGIGQLVLIWRVVIRGARYHAAVQVSRAVVLPIARPDPWKATVGPPGGPRYPLGGDEFGMSL